MHSARRDDDGSVQAGDGGFRGEERVRERRHCLAECGDVSLSGGFNLVSVVAQRSVLDERRPYQWNRDDCYVCARRRESSVLSTELGGRTHSA